MKRIISWVLTLVLVLSLFAGCGDNTEPTTASEAPTEAVAADTNLADAIAYLKAIYKTVEDGSLTPSDFQRLGTVRVGLDAYEITWTVDCDESAVKIVVGSDGMVTIDVNEDSEIEVPYVLTATITGTDGTTASLSWNHVLPVSMNGRGAEIVDAAYALEEGEALSYEATLTGEIISIDTPYSADYKNITVTIKVEGREDKPIMCYRLKGDGAEDLMPGDIITVTGTLKNYKGTIEFDAGCLLEKVEKGENSLVIPTDPQEILKAAFELDYGESLPYPVTLTGKIIGVKSKYSEQYGNITVMIRTGEPWYDVVCYRMKGEGVDKIWLDDEITVTGNMTNYNGTIEFAAGSQLVSWVDNPDPVAPSDPTAIVDAVYALEYQRSTLPYYCSLTGQVIGIDSKWSDTYKNISVWMRIPGRETMPILCYRLSGDGAKDLAVGDTITVYGLLMNYYGTREFGKGCQLTNVVKGSGSITGDPETGTECTVAEAKALKVTNNKIKVTGTITEIKSTTYGNMYIEDATGSIYIYGLYDESGARYDKMTPKPQVGDTITVLAAVSQYNGEAQLKNATLVSLVKDPDATEPEETEPEETEPGTSEPADGSTLTVAEAVALGNTKEHNTYTAGSYYVTGTITEIASDYYGNLYISDGTGSIYIYGLRGGSNEYFNKLNPVPKVGDTVTIYGTVGYYGSSAQMKNPKIQKHTVAGDSGSGDTTEVGPNSSLAEVMAAVKAGQTLDFDYTVTGTVKAVYTNGDGTKNIPIITSEGQINCNNVPDNGTDDWDNVAAGDTVTFTGKLTLKSGTTDNVRIQGAALVSRTAASGGDSGDSGDEGGDTTTVPATLKEQLEAASKLTSGTLPYQSTITGTITSTPKESSYTEGAYNFYVTDAAGNSVQCYYVPVNGGTPTQGASVTVTGYLSAYNGTAQFFQNNATATLN